MAATLFNSDRMGIREALDLTAASLGEYGHRYRHWAIAYSGGKDSTCALAVVLHLLRAGRVPPPDSLTVLYADTRMELPPLHAAATDILARVRAMGYDARTVLPPMPRRFYPYVLGRGIAACGACVSR